mgnify:CR=1 FL=1
MTKKIPFKPPSRAFYRETAEPKHIFDFLPMEDPVFIYADIFEQLDTSSIEAKYQVIGQHGFDPKMMMGLLIYSYSHGVFSSREIASRCRRDLGFMYLSWMLFPDFRSISEFRKNNIEEFKGFFKESVLLAKAEGMVNLGHVSLDGSKFKADTSKHKAMTYGNMSKREEELLEEIRELLDKANQVDQAEDSFLKDSDGEEISEDLQFKQKRLNKIRQAKKALEAREAQENPGKAIEGRKQISFADTEAKIMGKKGSFDYSYNGQITVESSHQIIVGEHTTQAANDQKELQPALEEVYENLGEKPEKASLDNGYFSADNLETLKEEKIDGYVASGGKAKSKEDIENTKSKIKKEDFVFNEEKDQFLCPDGKVLDLKSSSTDGIKVYQANPLDCQQCPLQAQCTTSKNGRSVKTDSKEPLREEMREKMQSPEAKEIYSLRKVIVEPVFGVIKSAMGFRGFNLRGKKKVSGEFSLICGAYNIKKIVIQRMAVPAMSS